MLLLRAPRLLCVAVRRQPRQAAVEFYSGIVFDVRRSRRAGIVKELVDHSPLLALIDVIQFDDDFADLPCLFGRKLIEHGIGRGRIEAGHQDGRLANSVMSSVSYLVLARNL